MVVDISAEKRDAALKAGAHKVVDGSGDGVTNTEAWASASTLRS